MLCNSSSLAMFRPADANLKAVRCVLGGAQCILVLGVMGKQIIVADYEGVDDLPEEASRVFISAGTIPGMRGCSAERADVLRGVEGDQQVCLQLLQANHSQLHLHSAGKSRPWPAALREWTHSVHEARATCS